MSEMIMKEARVDIAPLTRKEIGMLMPETR